MRFLVSLLLAACLSVSSFCQQTPAANPTPAPSSADTQQLGPDAPTREQILRLFDAMEIHKQMNSMLQSMQNNMEDMRKSQMPDFSRKQQGEIDELQKELYSKVFTEDQINKMLEVMLPIYQRHFSKADVNAIIAFYASPAGKKMLQEQPQIVKEYMSEIMQTTQEHMQEVMKAMDYDARLKRIMGDEDDALPVPNNQNKGQQKTK